MRRKAILITGANGEIGHGLITALHEQTGEHLIGLDIEEMDSATKGILWENIVGNILDRTILDRINSQYELTTIYHLAALLSTRAEFSPGTAHEVNVDGTLNLLSIAVEQSRSQGRPIKFFFPSSIAVYGLADLEEKNRAGTVAESQFLFPQTMYGCNKLYCELLGSYYARHYQRLTAEAGTARIDFRAIRFPGLISAVTAPSGGTSDYAPEMLHAAAQGIDYDCFVRDDTTIPFMTMPDAIRAIHLLMDAPREALSQLVYNIRAFNPSAAQFRERVLADFPKAEIGFSVNGKRQAMVDSWPADVDDSAARHDWGWQPEHDFEAAFADYLIPDIRTRYRIH
ncbi:MAG: NAD-dependent epimerase/dehydratase family protein [Fidelibacterota bacterium]|nr:MAG: NAD-dependent epimerase/dehydratase family protein [Candidatus Neomarinimicrobiota bacterium]